MQICKWNNGLCKTKLGIYSSVDRSGGLIAVLPNTPLVYYPDTLMETGVIVYLLSKV